MSTVKNATKNTIKSKDVKIVKVKDSDRKEEKKENKKTIKVEKTKKDNIIDDEIYQDDKIDNKNKKKSTGLKDLDKIIADPETYARDIPVSRLVTILQKLSDQYYGGAEPLVEDDTYDIMVEVLRERDPENAFLFQTGVTQTDENDIQLPFSMPSLNKIKPGEKPLARWFNTYTGPYIAMDKLDGISMQIYKNDKGTVDIYTKKQTNVGTSKKYLLKYLASDKILAKVPNGTSIRGEVVISKKNFDAIKKIDPDLKNPRSAMAGLVNTDKIDTRIAEKAQFVAYNILSPRYNLSEQLNKLKSWGFTTVWNKIVDLDADDDNDGDDDDDDEDMEDENDTGNAKIMKVEKILKNMLNDRKINSEYLVDGIVLADDSKVYQHSDDNPKYAMAFKMNVGTDMKDAVVEEVIWEPTMYGYLQPVVRIKPTVLSGDTTVTYVTAHNAKNVVDNNIGKGSVIKIVRSGDVIPYIVDVVTPSKKPDMPDVKYMWNDTAVDLIIVDPDKKMTRLINIKKNLHFFRKLGVKYLSDGITTKFYDAGYETITSIAAAACTKDTDPYKISGLGEKMVTKIYDQVDKAFEKIKLPELMAGSLKFGRGLGVRKIKEIIKKYPEILDFKNDTVSDIKNKILSVPGFSEILATKFAENLISFSEFLEELRENTTYDLAFKVEKKAVKKTKKSNKIVKDAVVDYDAALGLMAGEKVVVTGFRSDAIEEFIESNGGQMSSGVSKNTTLVIYVENDKTQSKLEKARDLGIKTITRTEFEKKYNIK